jgi:uncharacterized protein (TIGR02246 family)
MHATSLQRDPKVCSLPSRHQDMRWKAGECRVRGQLLIFSLLGALALPATAKEQCTQIDAKGAAEWFDQWNLALASLNPDAVAQHYWQDAMLLPTLSNTPRTTPAAVREYFVDFLDKHPRGRIDTHTLHLGCNLVVDMGTYTFALMDAQGHTSEVAARYTFVYAYRGGAWKILHHHSSAMPETAGSRSSHSKQPKGGAKGGGVPGAQPGSASKVSVIGGSQPFLNPDNSPNVAQVLSSPCARARRTRCRLHASVHRAERRGERGARDHRELGLGTARRRSPGLGQCC